jgi:VWFA-related protein
MRPLIFTRAARAGVALAFLFSSLVLSAQEIPMISVNVKVVNVLATVRDKRGKIVNTLGKDDFILEEDGRPQAIRYFTRETDIPLTLGLLVDTSLSQIEVIDEEKNASGAFVDDVLRADKDSAFLIHFDEEVELLQDLTSSPMKISQSLQDIDISRGGRNRSSYPSGGGRGGRHANAGTLLYDSIFLASDELMRKQKGRKAVVILTDGVDHGSKMSIDSAIESAQRADTVVYTIYFTGNEGTIFQRQGGMGGGRHRGGWPGGGGGWPGGGGGWPGGGGNGGGWPRGSDSADGKKVLERISRETGGRMFEVGKKQSITEIYADIQEELRNQYNLGYTPDRKDASVDYRRIQVSAKEKDLTVRAREGYYSSKQMDAKPVQGQ